MTLRSHSPQCPNSNLHESRNDINNVIIRVGVGTVGKEYSVIGIVQRMKKGVTFRKFKGGQREKVYRNQHQLLVNGF